MNIIKSAQILAQLVVGHGLIFAVSAAIVRVPQDQPSIQAAVISANAGDTIQISDGTYNEHGIVLTQSLTLKSVNGNAATTVNGQNLGGIFQINLPTTNKVIIQGLTITGGNVSGSWATVRRIAGLLEVRDCIFTQNYANGGVIDARGRVDYSIIEPDKTLVVDCVFRNNSAENFAGIVGATAVRCLLYNNTGGNNPAVLVLCNATNCTVYGNTGGFLGNAWTTGGMSGGNAVNCIFWGNSGNNGQQIDRTTAATVTYSIVQGGFTGTGNLSLDPLFVNAVNGDFHLSPNSPAIDAGNLSFKDPDGSRSDIGSFPFVPFSSGLVAYYPFNGNANDASGNGHNGTVTGATLTTDRFGRANQAYLFGGTAAYITAPFSSAVFSNDFTASLWFKANDIANGWPTLLHEENQSLLVAIGGLACGCSGPGKMLAYSSYAPATFGWFISPNQQTPIGTYCQLVVARAGTNVTMYLNSQVTVTGHVSNPTTQPGNTLWIGRSATEDVPGGYVFHGVIDDIRFYNRALSTTEIQQLYVYELGSGPSVNLIKAIKPSFSSLAVGLNYQLQISGDMNTWTNVGSPFAATNASMVYPQYWDVDDWGKLFFQLKATP